MEEDGEIEVAPGVTVRPIMANQADELRSDETQIYIKGEAPGAIPRGRQSRSV
jgi:hypothetical protein